MTSTAPSALFLRRVDVWRHLALRCDVDDLIQELLGRFSLEKIYFGSADKESYQQLVIHLVAQLGTLFQIQRLTLPAEDRHTTPSAGFLVSWEVGLRCVEFVLQVVVEGRESLWDAPLLRDKYLADFLLPALRLLHLHQHVPSSQKTKQRRDRFARIHRSLEQVFDSYPGPKSLPLVVCKEVTQQLHLDPHSLSLPPRLKYELPNMASGLYPLPECLHHSHIEGLVPKSDMSGDWLFTLLALRDIADYVVGAALQYAVHNGSQNPYLQTSLIECRGAIMKALDSIRVPSHISKMDLVAMFLAIFRTALPDTPSPQNHSFDPDDDDYELDALDVFATRLSDRQVIHRVSDVEGIANITEVMRSLVMQDDPSGQFRGPRPEIYASDCPNCHLVGGSQLREFGVDVAASHTPGSELRLSTAISCPQCGQPIKMVREVVLLRRVWELVRPLKPEAETINAERHLSTQFQIRPSRNIATATSPSFMPQRLDTPRSFEAPRPPAMRFDTPDYGGKTLGHGTSPDLESVQEHASSPPAVTVGDESSSYRRPSQANSVPSSSLTLAGTPATRTTPATSPRPPPLPEKGKSKWRIKFGGTKKAATTTSGDSNSLSSTTKEGQILEEIHLGELLGGPKVSERDRHARTVKVALSQQSTFALFWSPYQIQVWDAGVSPPSLTRAISTESTCLLAVVGKMYLAYMIGTRDQRLTLRIVNLEQAGVPVIEYRMPSTLWCKAMAIDKQETFVVIGFENSIVRFFRTATMDQPREDNLHSMYHATCNGCPSIETLAFSSNGMSLVASTRSPRDGRVYVYTWAFPFLTFHELPRCQTPVALHESEDNGVSSAIMRVGATGDNTLVCITTWTQSGSPVLIQPQDGYRSVVKAEVRGRYSGPGTRIQCAAFSPSGRELVMVNEKGHAYQISDLDSSPMDVKRVASSRGLTTKSEGYSMAFMTIMDEEVLVLAWADAGKATGWIKKIPTSPSVPTAGLETMDIGMKMRRHGISKEIVQPVELAATERIRVQGRK